MKEKLKKLEAEADRLGLYLAIRDRGDFADVYMHPKSVKYDNRFRGKYWVTCFFAEDYRRFCGGLK